MKRSEIIYLDNNATTPVAAEVVRAMERCLSTNFGNPSSSHAYGKKAKNAVEKSRTLIADLIGAEKDEIIFTSGGTEANNMAILGTALKFKSGHIIASCIEHPSVMNPIKHLEGLGYRVTYLPVNKYGIVRSKDLLNTLKEDTRLIALMHSNNETGSIQPVAGIGKIARNKNIPLLCDAAQSVGKVPVNVKKLNTDFLTVVSHKFYGPKGVGVLYIKKGVTIKPILFGASHEHGLRPGTENVASIIGLGKACELAKKEMSNRVRTMKSMTDKLFQALCAEIPALKLNGHASHRLPNTLNVSFPGISGAQLLTRLRKQIAASTGSACHEGTHSPSSVLKAMGVSDSDALSALRLSLGRTNTEREIQKAAEIIAGACRTL